MWYFQAALSVLPALCLFIHRETHSRTDKAAQLFTDTLIKTTFLLLILPGLSRKLALFPFI